MKKYLLTAYNIAESGKSRKMVALKYKIKKS